MRTLNNEMHGAALYFSFFFIPVPPRYARLSQGALQKKKNTTSSPFSISLFKVKSRGEKSKNANSFLFEQGTSLLETVLYIGIFAVITLLTVNTVLALTRAVGEIRSVRYIIRDSDTAMERMIREIRAAQSIDTITNIFNTHPGKLVLTGTSSTITFSLLGGEQFYFKKDAGSPTLLTSSSTRVTNLVFTHLTASSSEAVRVQMTMNNKKFHGTAVLRTNYK